MTRLGCLGACLLLAACVTHTGTELGTGEPSLQTGRAALRGGAPEIALTICARHAATQPRSAEALNCMGDGLAMLGRLSEADTTFTKALLLDPKSVGALLGLARLRLASEPKRAEDLLLQAQSQQPRNAAVLNDLGIARDLLGRHAEAQQSYAAAIAADPDMRAAQVNLALSVALAGRPSDAARMLLPVASGPDATTRERHDLAAVLAMSGRLDEARQLLRPELRGPDLDVALAGYRALLSMAPP